VGVIEQLHLYQPSPTAVMEMFAGVPICDVAKQVESRTNELKNISGSGLVANLIKKKESFKHTPTPSPSSVKNMVQDVSQGVSQHVEQNMKSNIMNIIHRAKHDLEEHVEDVKHDIENQIPPPE
jgi:hypothetical protein